MNTMVLAGLVIAVGVVVDDAIIDIENIMRRLREARREGGERSTASIVLEASLEVRGPIVYATLIIIAAAAPVFFLEGLSGSFFRPLVTVVHAGRAGLDGGRADGDTGARPSSCSRRAPLIRRDPPLVRYLLRGYARVLSRLVSRPSRAYCPGAGHHARLVVAVPQLGQSLLPEFKERDFLMHWVTKPGTSQPEEVRITTRASRGLRAIRGVRNFGAHIGQATHADEVVGIVLRGELDQRRPRGRLRPHTRAVQRVVGGYPGLFRDVQTYLKERIREVLTGAAGDRGPGLRRRPRTRCGATAEEVRVAMAGSTGSVDEHVELPDRHSSDRGGGGPRHGAAYGVKPGDVRRDAATMVDSIEVDDVWRPAGRTTSTCSACHPAATASTASGPCPSTPRAVAVRLAEVADVRVAPTPNAILRDDGTRRMDVAAERRWIATSAGGRQRWNVPSPRSSCPAGTRRDDRRARRARRPPSAAAGLRRAGAHCSAIFLLLQRRSAACAWQCCPSSRCRWRWSAASWPPAWRPVASCRWARWSGSSR